MKNFLQAFVFFSTILSFSTQAQVVVTNVATSYNQDFNSLSNSGSTNSTLPIGWSFVEVGSGGNTTYAADAGTSNVGNTYSYGTASETDRALGSVRSGSVASSYGVLFLNTSGVTITTISVLYTGEQWRLGGTNRTDALRFKYSLDATDLVSGTWTDVANLDFVTPATAGPTGAYNGNQVANRTNIAFDITGLNIPSGSSIWLRWEDTDVTGSDDGLAIDDVNISFNGLSTPICADPANQPTSLILTPASTSVSGSFTATAADNYLVVRSINSTLSASPVDATLYLAGQSFGGGTIVSVGSSTSFLDAGLAPNSTYHYFIFAFNSEECLAGPSYLSTSPLSANTTTAPLSACITPANSPTALILTPSNNTVIGSFTASATANKYLVVRSISNTLNTTPTNGVTYTQGQTFGNGIVVDYTSSTSFVATGLTTSTNYYFYIFAANGECNGEPFYRTVALTGNITTTNTNTGIPTGYYNSTTGLTCGPLKTALKTIISANTKVLSYTPGVWDAIEKTDMRRNDANTADIIWDMYTDNPDGPELYTFTYGTDQCGTYGGEGDCYNREHSFPREWFGGNNLPMLTDLHHVFPTDGAVNGKHDSYPYGEVSNPTYTSKSNKSKLGPNTTGCYTGTVFEPINAYKGDIARAHLYMITRYQDNMVAWENNGLADAVLNGTTYPSLEDWYIQLLIKWHNLDPVSQKEINRNNAIYAIQGNRNPFVDHPEYVEQMFSCVTFGCTIPVKLVNFGATKINQSVVLNWNVENELNLKYYIVERSTDGVHFTKVGEVSGQSLSKYVFTDNNLPTSQAVYYRLRSVDIDGKTTINKVVSVRLNNNANPTIIFPNPVKDNLTIKLQKPLTENSVLKIRDIVGRLYVSKNINSLQNVFQYNVERLPAGRYIVTIENSGEIIKDSFVIIK